MASDVPKCDGRFDAPADQPFVRRLLSVRQHPQCDLRRAAVEGMAERTSARVAHQHDVAPLRRGHRPDPRDRSTDGRPLTALAAGGDDDDGEHQGRVQGSLVQGSVQVHRFKFRTLNVTHSPIARRAHRHRRRSRRLSTERAPEADAPADRARRRRSRNGQRGAGGLSAYLHRRRARGRRGPCRSRYRARRKRPGRTNRRQQGAGHSRGAVQRLVYGPSLTRA